MSSLSLTMTYNTFSILARDTITSPPNIDISETPKKNPKEPQNNTKSCQKLPEGYNLPFKSSQGKFDRLVYRSFYENHDKCGEGVVLECGALDGRTYSNSFFFENHLHWKAIHVEASPTNFPKLEKYRRKATNVHAAICKEDFATFRYDSNRNAVGGISDTINEEHAKKFLGNAKEERIKCVTFEKLFEEHGITHVDVMVLDVEGGELIAVETINFKKVQIDVFVIELDGRNLTKDEKVREILKQNGYISMLEQIIKTYKVFERNDVWVHRDSLVMEQWEQSQ